MLFLSEYHGYSGQQWDFDDGTIRHNYDGRVIDIDHGNDIKDGSLVNVCIAHNNSEGTLFEGIPVKSTISTTPAK